MPIPNREYTMEAIIAFCIFVTLLLF
jgi:hypothetical protein